MQEQLLYRNVQRFRGGLAFKANSRLESNKEEEETAQQRSGIRLIDCWTTQPIRGRKRFLSKSREINFQSPPFEETRSTQT